VPEVAVGELDESFVFYSRSGDDKSFRSVPHPPKLLQHLRSHRLQPLLRTQQRVPQRVPLVRRLMQQLRKDHLRFRLDLSDLPQRRVALNINFFRSDLRVKDRVGEDGENGGEGFGVGRGLVEDGFSGGRGEELPAELLDFCCYLVRGAGLGALWIKGDVVDERV
jgi:hypothetical protein